MLFSCWFPLCNMGTLCPDPSPLSTYSYRYKHFSKSNMISYLNPTQIKELTLLEALALLFRVREFDDSSEHSVSAWIRNGLICAQQHASNYIIFMLIERLHSYNPRTAYRIARQLLALGLFRIPRGDPKLSWAQRCFYGEMISRSSEVCAKKHSSQTTEECSAVAPLLTEFFRKPLSLQQLSRIEIRQSIGINSFERRVKTLPLPVPLLTYVWRANEMLAGNTSSS